MLIPRICALFCALALSMLPVRLAAHEFWIDPLRYQVAEDEKLQANFKNGELFKGAVLSFFDRSSARFDLFANGMQQTLTPRSGDSPALDIDPPVTDGLIVVVHETTPSLITYSEWAKFLKFAAHKDFPDAATDHIAAGWSQERFRERYTRHVKALMAVGAGEGQDQTTGLKTEFVALTNPYAAAFEGPMRVQVTFDGQPRVDAQVEVFDRAPDQTVTVSLYRTDAEGIATVPVTPGHDYLFDAVTLRPAAEASTDENAIVWETYWAALTFSVPD